jgi:hypothetical protein
MIAVSAVDTTGAPITVGTAVAGLWETGFIAS